MFLRFNYENSNDIGVFVNLTNTYCIVPCDINEKCEKFLEKALKKKIPIIKTSILNSKCIGRLVLGNKNGLILPYETSYDELKKIQKMLPENVLVKKCTEKFSALGNCIVSNDNSALSIPEISMETETLLADVMGVEVFKIGLGSGKLIGSFCKLNNNGGIISQFISLEDQDEISSLLKIPLTIGSINGGEKILGSGLICNDWVGFCGIKTTQTEIFVLETGLQKR